MEKMWIWPFELLDKLGEGGMGVVYRARYVGNNRQVAVKLIPNEISANATILARFERELEVLKQLRHPNIVHCFGGRCESKQRFYAMELIPGGTLAEYLAERGRLPWENAVDFAIQMCAALQHAHDRGVIHRDIKPGNFLVTKSGQLKLSDFGLAAVVAERRLTAAGRTVGTILYMAPEQIRGGTLTNRADLYSLGCVLYEMISGQTPFSGENAAEILQRHLKDPPPHVARLALDCPIELDSLICELLSKDATLRPVSASEVEARLTAILLPSRRKNVAEPELFASIGTKAALKTVPITPLKNVTPDDSEMDLSRSGSHRGARIGIPWIVTAVAFFICLQLWFGWANAATQLRRLEQSWTNELDTADASTRVFAAKALSNFDRLSPVTIQKLSDVASSQTAELKIAALKSLTEHPAESRPVAAELTRIQKVDENPEVRAEAARALDAVQKNAASFSLAEYAFWPVVLTVAAGLIACGWWVWKKFEAFAD